jgi:ribosomal protein S20
MPVSKTAKRALRSSAKKAHVNSLIISRLEIAVRVAKTKKTKDAIIKAVSLADKASKKHAIHPNKAARIKSALSKLMPKGRKIATKKTPVKKTSPKKARK